jgi:hypothetical protein
MGAIALGAAAVAVNAQAPRAAPLPSGLEFVLDMVHHNPASRCSSPSSTSLRT